MNQWKAFTTEMKTLQQETIILVEGRAFAIRPVTEEDIQKMREEQQ